MNQQKHLVFGAGLIGSYLAGCFISDKLDTQIVGRERVREAMTGGLTVSDYEGNEATLPSPKFAEAGSTYDIIWLTIKCTAVTAVIPDLANYLDADTMIICCQNGLGSDAIIRDAFPKNTVLSAIVGFNVAEPSPAHFHRSTQGDLVVESHPVTQRVIEKLQSKLLPVHLSEDIEAERWAKLQLNLANPVNALADIPTKQMVEDAGFRKIIIELMREHLLVTDALGLDLPKVAAVSGKNIPRLMGLPNWIYKIIAQKTLAIDPTARVSMWWDLNGGRITEIDYLNGAVVDRASELNIDCPVNKKIVELIHNVEQGSEDIGFSAKQLQAKLFV